MAALYNEDMLIDAIVEKAVDIKDGYVFAAELKTPEDISGCTAFVMKLDADFMILLTDYTVKP